MPAPFTNDDLLDLAKIIEHRGREIAPDRRNRISPAQASRTLDAAATQFWRTQHKLTDAQIAWAREYFAHGETLDRSARLAKAKTEGLPC